MKTRIGFVSNSSSSSFIVFYPYKPKSPQDIMNILFDGKDQKIVSGYSWESDKTSMEVSTYLFNCKKDECKSHNFENPDGSSVYVVKYEFGSDCNNGFYENLELFSKVPLIVRSNH